MAFRVVLVGRPNVGKSAVFNRLYGRRRALVHDKPGMTRDALEVAAVTGSGRPYTLVDTGGLDLDAAGGFAQWTSERALHSVADADLLLFVLDGIVGLLPEDKRLTAKLRALGKPTVVVWNKVDAKAAEQGISDAHALGFDRIIGLSALHGTGVDDLEDLIDAALPPDLDADTRTAPLPIAIVGRPNVGKSSLVNALLGGDRVMVSEVAGTTRDPIDVVVERRVHQPSAPSADVQPDGSEGPRAATPADVRRYLLVDTAGIRRKGKTHDAAEILSVLAAKKSLERARIAVIVFDAFEGITSQDATITGYAEEAGCGILLVANKWDLIEKDRERCNRLKAEVQERFVFARRAPFLPLSTVTRRSVSKLLPEADALAQRYATKMSTGELNRLLQKSFERQSPRGRNGRDMKIRYAVQSGSEPPVIRLFADRAEQLHFSFERYLQNRLREKWPLDGVPLRFVVRKSE